MARIFDTFMLRDELDMMQARLEELEDAADFHIVTEAPVTHRGVPKPLHYQENAARFAPWAGRIVHVVADLPDSADPWAREHAQRDAAMAVLAELAADDDVVLIGDLDEFPSATALGWRGPGAVALQMRTCLFAVDWLVPDSYPLPPAAVMATVRFIRDAGGSLAGVRDRRSSYRVIEDGGWHLSWIGGPERQRDKLLNGTCHTEIAGTPEADLIASGERYRTDRDGGGIPVVPADVDGSWPGFVFRRECPAQWFRPRW